MTALWRSNNSVMIQLEALLPPTRPNIENYSDSVALTSHLCDL
jgi:hypothetical protein